MGPLLELPADLRSELKEPLGTVHTDTETLLSDAGRPIVAVGDVVTHHLLAADYRPAVALVDGKTKREAVDDAVAKSIGGFDRTLAVASPAGGLSQALLETLRTAVAAEGSTLVDVDGEEDLAALPAVLVLPDTASVVYGQPNEGMVLATVDTSTRGRVRALLDRFDGDHEAAYAALGR
jgi:uncharacterized protein (UPF0218 family)